MKKHLFLMLIAISTIVLIGGLMYITNKALANQEEISELNVCDSDEGMIFSFNSFNELSSAKLTRSGGDTEILESVDGLFVPNVLPSTASLKKIILTKESRTVLYSVNQSSDIPTITDDEIRRLQTQFKIVEFLAEDAEEKMVNLLYMLSSKPSTEFDGVYTSDILRTVTARDGIDHRIVAAKELVWTDGNSVFYACYPSSFSTESILLLTNISKQML